MEVLLREARNHKTKVTFLEIFRGFILPGDETPPERAIGYRGDTKLAAGLKKADLGVLDVGCEGAVFDLDGSNRVDFVGTAEGGRGDLAKTKVLDFSFPAESQTLLCIQFTVLKILLHRRYR